MRPALLVLSAVLAACGGSPPASPGPPPSTGPTITIASGGVVSPKELQITPGSRVLFINNDSRRHDMTSDPHPEHGDCPEIDQVGLLNSGQRRDSGNFVAVRTCGYHDHEDPFNTNLHGRIVVR